MQDHLWGARPALLLVCRQSCSAKSAHMNDCIGRNKKARYNSIDANANALIIAAVLTTHIKSRRQGGQLHTTPVCSILSRLQPNYSNYTVNFARASSRISTTQRLMRASQAGVEFRSQAQNHGHRHTTSPARAPAHTQAAACTCDDATTTRNSTPCNISYFDHKHIWPKKPELQDHRSP